MWLKNNYLATFNNVQSKTVTWAQFYQMNGAKRKCAILWCHPVSPTELCPILLVRTTRKYAQLLLCTLCASKIGVNLLALKLPIEPWWNWPLISVFVFKDIHSQNFDVLSPIFQHSFVTCLPSFYVHCLALYVRHMSLLYACQSFVPLI